jgi:hypothetical protein
MRIRSPRGLVFHPPPQIPEPSMNPKTRMFRPALLDRLEDRTVPSGPGVVFALGVQIGIAPNVDAQIVSNAFTTFEQMYNADVTTVLIAGGAIHPANFTMAVNNALLVLNSTIGNTLSNLPSATSPASAIAGELIGAAATTMQTRLAALKVPTSAQSHFTRLYVAQADAIIATFDNMVFKQVANATPPTGSVTVDRFQSVLSRISSEIGKFNQAYVGSIFSVLVPFGTTNPSANKAAFDSTVATELQTLSGKILQDIGTLPASVVQRLSTAIPNDILSNPTNSANLQDALAAVPAPTTIAFSGIATYMNRSSKVISAGVQSIVNELTAALNAYNSGLPPA